MGDADAQYELACRLRVENEYVQSDQQAFHYLEKAVDQDGSLSSHICIQGFNF
ncbi:putative tetratricopeptide-like helical domain-containing protein [Rosa chinensis]|uniref:Putative tetratricopeptide-like helical domain-containing protein n=1 Tax=Rosa chinensis TaxID=74649 RepID=A0A2P6RJ21_ROSCH|nr:putative tetratricopeptide-like helical domain-containing protein [Rosa chinensis]